MSRGLTSAMTAGVQETNVQIVLFFEGEFATGTVRLCTYFRDLTWNSQTWIGAGTFAGISDIEENTEVVASGVTVSLSGVETSLVALAISEARQNLPGKVWVGLLESSTPALPYGDGDVLDGGTAALAGTDTLDAGTAATAYTETLDGGTAPGVGTTPEGALSIVADPYLAFSGRLDVPEITDGQDTCTVAITYESILVDLLRPRQWRYTHESQQVLSPGDKGLEYVTKIQEQPITWGVA